MNRALNNIFASQLFILKGLFYLFFRFKDILMANFMLFVVKYCPCCSYKILMKYMVEERWDKNTVRLKVREKQEIISQIRILWPKYNYIIGKSGQ